MLLFVLSHSIVSMLFHCLIYSDTGLDLWNWSLNAVEDIVHTLNIK